MQARPLLGETAGLALLGAFSTGVLELDERITSAVVRRIANALRRTLLPAGLAGAELSRAVCGMLQRAELEAALTPSVATTMSAEIRRKLLHAAGDDVLKRLLEYQQILLEAREYLEPRLGLALLGDDTAAATNAAVNAAVEQAYAQLERFEGKRPYSMPRSLPGLVTALGVCGWRLYRLSAPEVVDLARQLEAQHDALLKAFRSTIHLAEGHAPTEDAREAGEAGEETEEETELEVREGMEEARKQTILWAVVETIVAHTQLSLEQLQAKVHLVLTTREPGFTDVSRAEVRCAVREATAEALVEPFYGPSDEVLFRSLQ